MYIDTHAHLYAPEFDQDRSVMIQRALDAGVQKIYLPNIDSTSIEGMLALEKQYPNICVPMMGLHPCYVKENYEEELSIVKEWLDKRPFCAIGEIGIDLYWDKTYLEQQVEAFRTQIRWAKDLGIPIIIHARESMDEILEVVEAENDDKLKGIFHCFSGNIHHAERVIALGGFLMGIGGTITFKNSGKMLRSVVERVGLEYLVLETDAPYLSPVPHRGKRNESAYIPLIVDKISEVKSCSKEEIAEITTNNAENLLMTFV